MKNIKGTIAILICGLMTISFTACTTAPVEPVLPPTPPAMAIPGLSEENYPRVNGSTANLPLIAQMYSEVCGVSIEDAEAFAEVDGTSEAWLALANGNTDLLVVYEASKLTAQELEELDVKLDITPLGRDGLVFLVNGKNKVDSLTQDQLRGIYTGKTTDWGEVDGTAGTISPFQRNETSGSQTMFLKLLMGDAKPMEAPTELVSGTMGGLVDAVAAFDGTGGAIGYSVYYYAQEMYNNPDLKILKVDGVAPTPQSIGNASYPLVNDFVVAIRADEKEGSPARLLRDWLLTDAGKKALTTAGYVNIG